VRPLEEVIKDIDPSWEIDLNDGDIVLDMVVLARVVRLDSPGRTNVCISMTEQTDSVVLVGLLESAKQITVEGWD